MTSKARVALWISAVLALAAIVICVAWWALVPEEAPEERVRVSIELVGAGPEQIDEEIGARLADALVALDPDVEVSSIEGRAEAVLELPGDGTALDRVRDRITALTRELPSEASPPLISREARGETLRWLLRGEEPELRMFSVRARALAVQGVTQLVSCAREREVHVVVDPMRAAALAVDAEQVADAIARSNVAVSGGYIVRESDEVLVRGSGLFEVGEDIAHIVVLAREGLPVRVRDVASVSEGLAPRHCACSVASERCASASMRVADTASAQAVRDALLDEHVTWIDAQILALAPAGTSDEELDRLGSTLARCERRSGSRARRVRGSSRGWPRRAARRPRALARVPAGRGRERGRGARARADRSHPGRAPPSDGRRDPRGRCG